MPLTSLLSFSFFSLIFYSNQLNRSFFFCSFSSSCYLINLLVYLAFISLFSLKRFTFFLYLLYSKSAVLYIPSFLYQIKAVFQLQKLLKYSPILREYSLANSASGYTFKDPVLIYFLNLLISFLYRFQNYSGVSSLLLSSSRDLAKSSFSRNIFDPHSR